MAVRSIPQKRSDFSLCPLHCKCAQFKYPEPGNQLVSNKILTSTHYTNDNFWLFAVNVSALIFVLIPKLPQVRFICYHCIVTSILC